MIQLNIRCSEGEAEAWKAASNGNLSGWMRERLNAAAGYGCALVKRGRPLKGLRKHHEKRKQAVVEKAGQTDEEPAKEKPEPRNPKRKDTWVDPYAAAFARVKSFENRAPSSTPQMRDPKKGRI